MRADLLLRMLMPHLCYVDLARGGEAGDEVKDGCATYYLMV